MPFSHCVNFWHRVSIFSVSWQIVMFLSKYGSASSVLSFVPSMLCHISENSFKGTFLASMISGTSSSFSLQPLFSCLLVTVLHTSLSSSDYISRVSQMIAVSIFPWLNISSITLFTFDSNFTSSVTIFLFLCCFFMSAGQFSFSII